MSTTGAALSPGSIDDLHTLSRRGFAAPAYKRQAKKQAASGRYLTLQECADEFGLTKERVRQIEKKALEKCLDYCQRHGYRLEELIR